MGLNDRIDDFCEKLRQRRVSGSLAAARGTAEILRQVITSSRLTDPQDNLKEIKTIGIKIQSSNPVELVIGNIVRRVMHIIREEMEEDIEEDLATSTFSLDSRDSIMAVSGGLSRAFNKTTSNTGRTLSLHNLLDQGLNITDGGSKSGDKTPPMTPTHHTSSPSSHKKSKQQQQLSPILQGKEPRSSRRSIDKDTRPVRSTTTTSTSSTGGGDTWDRKQEVIDGVNDLIEELKDIDNAIAAQAPEHIHANEVILTFGYSRTVLNFMKRAREKRDFQSVVAEAAPTLQGHLMARELADAGITTTAIPDNGIFAMMSRVNKVLVSAHAILADGGVMAPVGTRLVALAAKRYSVPFVVLAGIYRLSPLFPHEPGVTFNEFKDPSDILPYQDQAVLAADLAGAACIGENESDDKNESDGEGEGTYLQVHNPSYDYIPPELISLFVTDHGHGFMPSYVYRMLSEYYDRVDYQLSRELMDTIMQ
jgi:translation initiation factor eIF-2B subunit beta